MEYFKIDPQNPDPQVLDKAVETLRKGGVIVYPTDTVYGLGVDINNEKAVNRLYLLKKRDIRNPVPIMVHSVDQIEQLLGALPVNQKNLLKKLLPGKITILLKNTLKKPLQIFKQFDNQPPPLKKIGFRIPDYPVCYELIKKFGGPITTTSANISGKGNVLSIPEALAHFGDKLDLILDAGVMASNAGSTVIDFTKDPYLIVRKGEIEISDLKMLLPAEKFRIRRNHFTINFVCSGNICRSPLAEAALKAMVKKTKYKKYIEITSSGTLDITSSPAHKYSIKVAQENDIDLSGHKSKTITPAIVKDSDLIFCMALNHYEFLRQHYPKKRRQIVLLKQWNRENKLFIPSIADPIGNDLDFYCNTFKEIHQEIKRILPFLFTELKVFMDYNDLS